MTDVLPLSKFANRLAIIGVVLVSCAILFYILFLNHVAITEVGLAYNSWNGDLQIQDKPGWYITSPFIRVANISTKPEFVTIPSGAKVINTKLVRFKPEGAREFVEIQGFGYDLGMGQENIMLGYAFSNRPWPFLEIVQEGGPEKELP